mgnify:FL=1|tara:strand:+ start:83 stop:607 length:525 start_codon:yes stop_codon:yes gene_type:complete
MTIHNMHDSLIKGGEGEPEVIAILEKQFGISCRDVRLDPRAQKDDIDYYYTIGNNPTEHGLEIKTDFYFPKNVALEVISTIQSTNPYKGTEGCILKTKSDRLAYYFIKHNKLIMCETKGLQKFTLDAWKSGKYRQVEIDNKTWRALVILVPVKEFEQQKFITKIINNTKEILNG